MSGLDEILSQIKRDADDAAATEISAAQAEADKIIAAAKIEGNKRAEEILQNAKSSADDIKMRSESSAHLIDRNKRLIAKQQLISETIATVLRQLENAPDDEYFSYILKLYSRNARPGKCEMKLSARDISRLPKKFEAELKACAPETSVTISSEPVNILGGFILDYGGIDINCTFSAVFDACSGELRDVVSKALFNDE